MNLCRILNYGSKCFSNFPQSLPALTTIRLEKLPSSNFFSSFSNSNRYLECSELTLSPFSPLSVISRGMKVRGHLQLRCKDCYFLRKDGIMYVNCSSFPRHKQKALTKREKYTWLLTYCFQSKKRPY